jgi:hypothetical protein
MMSETCAGCFYSRGEENDFLRCHRHAPTPFSFYRFYDSDILRDVAWSLRDMTDRHTEDKSDDVNIEPTEAMGSSQWPEVFLDGWCGEWKSKIP